MICKKCNEKVNIKNKVCSVCGDCLTVGTTKERKYCTEESCNTSEPFYLHSSIGDTRKLFFYSKMTDEQLFELRNIKRIACEISNSSSLKRTLRKELSLIYETMENRRYRSITNSVKE